MKRYLTNTRSPHSVAQPEIPSPIHHGPSSRVLGKMRVSEYSEASQASSSSSTFRFWLSRSSFQKGSQASSTIRLDSTEASPLRSPSPIPYDIRTHNYPTPKKKTIVRGVTFDVNFNHVYWNDDRLQPSRLCCAVQWKGAIAGGRVTSHIWAHGLQLQFTQVDNIITSLWQCRGYHQLRSKSGAKLINGTAHIKKHIRRKHLINPSTSARIPTISVDVPEYPFTTAAHVPGSLLIRHRRLREKIVFKTLLLIGRL
jgi:hypothetical protein